MYEHTVTTVGGPLDRPPDRSDERLTRVAAGLITAAHNGDERGVARLLSGVEPYRLCRLFMLLAAVADRDALLYAAGFADMGNLRKLRWEYRRLRDAGLSPSEIDPYVVQGARMYGRIGQRALRKSRAAAGG